MKKIWLVILTLVVIMAIVFGSYWANTQPVWIVSSAPELTADVPGKNADIVRFIEENGETLAPDYDSVVCTEFVVKVIEKFYNLSARERQDIHIITEAKLNDLIASEAPMIRGVQTALIRSGKGSAIDDPYEVQPGDFVQFWNIYNGKAHGHCAIVMEVNPGSSLTVYSSHRLTGGYGKQKFLWPDKAFFARLN
jgi:hypothetical protein